MEILIWIYTLITGAGQLQKELELTLHYALLIMASSITLINLFLLFIIGIILLSYFCDSLKKGATVLKNPLIKVNVGLKPKPDRSLKNSSYLNKHQIILAFVQGPKLFWSILKIYTILLLILYQFGFYIIFWSWSYSLPHPFPLTRSLQRILFIKQVANILLFICSHQISKKYFPQNCYLLDQYQV